MQKLKIEEIMAFIELVQGNWRFAVLAALGMLLATYLIAVIKALGAEHGKRLGGTTKEQESEEPKVSGSTPVTTISQKLEKASKEASISLHKNISIITLVIGILSVSATWVLTRVDPCLKPASQMSIQEKISCEN